MKIEVYLANKEKTCITLEHASSPAIAPGGLFLVENINGQPIFVCPAQNILYAHIAENDTDIEIAKGKLITGVGR